MNHAIRFLTACVAIAPGAAFAVEAPATISAESMWQLKRVANFKTPTLVVHGQLDQRVPINQGMELFQTLQNRGVSSRLVYFPDENHWILKRQNSLYWYREVKDWLARFAPAGGR